MMYGTSQGSEDWVWHLGAPHVDDASCMIVHNSGAEAQWKSQMVPKLSGALKKHELLIGRPVPLSSP